MTPSADGHDDPLEEQLVVEQVQLGHGLVALLTLRPKRPPAPPPQSPAAPPRLDDLFAREPVEDLFSRPPVPPLWL